MENDRAEIGIKFSEFPPQTEFSAEDAKRVKDIVTWLVFRHPRDYRVTASRLMKLYYMAELRAIEKLGRRLSRADFVNWNYGPWSQGVAMIADSVHPDIGMERGKTKDGRDAKFYKAKMPQTSVDLPKEEMHILDEVIKEWYSVKTKNLVEASKDTYPFRSSKYGELIDFDTYANCWRELKSGEAVREIRKNIADARAGKGKTIRNEKELEAYMGSL
jgi:uncharacterized phage-associated protein